MQKLCRYGNKCWNIKDCKYAHYQEDYDNVKACRYGRLCKNQSYCKFSHPQTNISEKNGNLSNLPTRSFIENYDTKSEPDFERFRLNQKHSQKSCAFSVKMLHDDSVQGQQFQFSETISYSSLSKQTLSANRQQQKKTEENNLNSLNKIHQGQQQYLQNLLEEFFNVRLVKSAKFDAIYSLIQESVSLENVPVLIEQIKKIEQSQFGPHFTYLKIVKTIIKKGLNYQAICCKLQKQMNIKLKKQQKNIDFLTKIPNPIPYDVVTDGQIFQQTVKNPSVKKYFVIDGDNVINTHKIFRKYYRSGVNQIIAQGQIRLRWLLSEIDGCVLFFDHQKVKSQVYEEISQKIMYKEQLENYKKQNWKFANHYQQNQQNQQEDIVEDEQSVCSNASQQSFSEKDLSQQNSKTKLNADKLILNWLQQLSNKQKQMQCEIILVTADRLLIQYCLQKKSENKNIQISSGKFFIKYCKQYIRRKYYGNKMKKGVIKRMFSEPKYD